MRPGDILFVHGTSLYSRLIQFGQRLRRRGPERTYTYWTHVALVTDRDGGIIEARSRGVQRSNLFDDYGDRVNFAIYEPPEHPVDRAEMIAFAESCLGDRYGWVTACSVALHIATGFRLSFLVDSTHICSGLVAGALSRGTYIYETPEEVTPADLAAQFGVRGKG